MMTFVAHTKVMHVHTRSHKVNVHAYLGKFSARAETKFSKCTSDKKLPSGSLASQAIFYLTYTFRT